MNEKTMTADALSQANSGLEHLGEMITQTQNQKLRQTLIRMRNAAEVSQYELYDLAAQHGYYQPAANADSDEIRQVRQIFEGTSMLS